MHLGLRLAVPLLISAVASTCFAQRVGFSADDGNFDPQGLINGVAATQEQCAGVRHAVWARAPSGDAECIRYWSAGLADGGVNARVLFYLPSDQMVFDQPDAGYAARSPKSMQALADGMRARAGLPFILLSRPGTFGSSGEHKQRRRELESRLTSAALDEIKKRHRIDELALAGLSGGGHTVAALLGWRSDIVCAVPASAVSSPRMRWRLMGHEKDLTGLSDSYEPVENLKSGVFHANLRVFVLGDVKDSNVMWETQTPLAAKLKALGVKVELVNAEGSDPQHHSLGGSSQVIGSMCARDRSTQEILETVARGLKG